MLNPAVLLVGLVITQTGVDAPEGAPTPAITPVESQDALPIAPLPMDTGSQPENIVPDALTAQPDAPNGGQGQEEISQGERQARDRHMGGIPGWGPKIAANGWYPSTRHMEPYVEPYFGKLCYKPAWHNHHWWFSPGDMVQHLAYYPTMHSYYYARPYHPLHIPHHQGLAHRYATDPRNPYDNEIFERVYESLKKDRGENVMELIEPGEVDSP